MGETDLTKLVARAKNGDRAAFEKIVHTTARVVYAQIVASVRDRQKAEDLTQETFVAAWKAIATVEHPAGFLSWLLTLARNKVLDAIKHDSRQKRGGTGVGDPSAADVDLQAPSHELTPAKAAELAEAKGRALELLEQLPEDYRIALSMRYLAGAEYDTIRAALGLTDGALRGILNRGMAILRERFSRTEYRL